MNREHIALLLAKDLNGTKDLEIYLDPMWIELMLRFVGNEKQKIKSAVSLFLGAKSQVKTPMMLELMSIVGEKPLYNHLFYGGISVDSEEVYSHRLCSDTIKAAVFFAFFGYILATLTIQRNTGSRW
jgi:hypothetical protein